MKHLLLIALTVFFYNSRSQAQNLYMDIHYMQPGKVKAEDVAAAHQQDLAIQKKYSVTFLKYWVDEKNGIVYCLSSAKDSASVSQTHQHAHGLMPAEILLVKEGEEAKSMNGNSYFMDIHQLGAGKVTAEDVAAAHKKDLAVQQAHGVQFINYWVSEKTGKVFCLSQAPATANIVDAHKEAHGLLPNYVELVKQGQ
ncbi:MAG TPA: DUF4242 domain-containing protein [Chitinophagaceae bacterium]